MPKFDFPGLSPEEVLANDKAKKYAYAYIILALYYSYTFVDDEEELIKHLYERINKYAVLVEVPFSGNSPDKQASFVATVFYEILISYGPKIADMLKDLDQASTVMYNRKLVRGNVSHQDLANMIAEALASFWFKAMDKNSNIILKITREISENKGQIHHIDNKGNINVVSMAEYMKNYLIPMVRDFKRLIKNIDDDVIESSLYKIVFQLDEEGSAINVSMPLTRWLIDKASFYFNLPQVFAFHLFIDMMFSSSVETFTKGLKFKRNIERFFAGSSDKRALERYREHVDKANRLLFGAIRDIGMSAWRPIEEGIRQNVFGKLFLDLGRFGWQQVYHRTGGLFGLMEEKKPYERLYSSGEAFTSFGGFKSFYEAEKTESIKKSADAAYERIEKIVGRQNAERIVSDRKLLELLARYPAMLEEERKEFAQQMAKEFNLFTKEGTPNEDAIDRLSNAVHSLLVKTRALQETIMKQKRREEADSERFMFSSTLQNKPYGMEEPEETGKKPSLPSEVSKPQAEASIPKAPAPSGIDTSGMSVTDIIRLVNSAISTSIKELVNEQLIKPSISTQSGSEVSKASFGEASKISAQAISEAITQKIQPQIGELVKQYVQSNIPKVPATPQKDMHSDISSAVNEAKKEITEEIKDEVSALEKQVQDLKSKDKALEDKISDLSSKQAERLKDIAAKVDVSTVNRLNNAFRKLNLFQRQMSGIRGRFEGLRKQLSVTGQNISARLSLLTQRSRIARAGLRGLRKMGRGLGAASRLLRGGNILTSGLGVLRGLGAIGNIARLGPMLTNPLGLALGLGALGTALYAGYRVFSKGILPQLQGKGYSLAGQTPEKDIDEAIKEIKERQEKAKKKVTLKDIKDSAILSISPGAGIGEAIARSVRATSGVSISLGGTKIKPENQNVMNIVSKRGLEIATQSSEAQNFSPQPPNIPLPKEPQTTPTEKLPQPNIRTLTDTQVTRDAVMLSNAEVMGKVVNLLEWNLKKLNMLEEKINKQQDVKPPFPQDP